MQSAERLVVSSTLPIAQFAQYSLCSAMFVPLTAITTVSQVFFSDVVAVEHGDRVRIYGHMSRFLIAWSSLLPRAFLSWRLS